MLDIKLIQNDFETVATALRKKKVDESLLENLRTLSKAICSYENPEMTTAPEFRSYDDALGEISRIAQNQRVVFVIDEYPYLAAADPSISSRLQHLIDHVWSESKLYLIL